MQKMQQQYPNALYGWEVHMMYLPVKSTELLKIGKN